MGEPITVAIIEDHPLFRDALTRLVIAEAEFRLAVAVGSVEEFEADFAEVVQVVILDLNLPGLAGAVAVRRIVASGCGVLVVSAAARPEVVAGAVAAGARGYLTKDSDSSEIVDAIRTVASRGTHLPIGSPKRGTGLTQREVELLGLLAGGATDGEIATALFISIRTVGSHLDRIRQKTGRRRRPDLTRLAYEVGAVDGH